MYTERMTIDELVEEFKADIPQIISISNAKQVKADKIIKRSTHFPVYLHAMVKTKRGNNWMILLEAKSRKYIGDCCLITLVSMYESDHGRYAIMRAHPNGKSQYIFFTPHFFQRFSARTGIDLSGVDLIHRYFKINPSYGFSYNKELVGDVMISNIYGSTTEGVALGIKPDSKNDVVLFKTFITYEMCKGEQIEEFAKSDELRKELYEQLISLEIG